MSQPWKPNGERNEAFNVSYGRGEAYQKRKWNANLMGGQGWGSCKKVCAVGSDCGPSRFANAGGFVIP